jgi:HisJ family histidinol phosphate phosphatase
VRRALNLAQAGDLLGAAETAGVELPHAGTVSEGLRRGMRFAIGAEIDNDPRARPDAQNIVDALRPDGIIRSVHFVSIQHPEKGADWSWAFDSEEFAALHEVVGAEKLWELYTAKLFDDIEKLPTHIVGHFYVPATLGKWPSQKLIEGYEDRLLEICHQRGLGVEINSRFLYRDHPEDQKKKFLEANARLIRKAKAARVGIAIGSDAHSPKDQGNAFDLILKLLDDAKVNELVFPVGGRLARVALRATREHLEAEAQSRRQPATPGSSISGYSRAELGLPEEAEPAHRSTREGGPKKRATPPTPSTSRRSADSSSSSSKAKAARAAKPPPPPKKTAKPVEAPVKKRAAAPAPAPKKVSKPAPARALAKKSPAKKAALAKKAPVKKAPVHKSAARKSAAAKPAPAKPARKKIVAKKAAPHHAPKPKRPAAGHAKKVVKKKKPAAKRR